MLNKKTFWTSSLLAAMLCLMSSFSLMAAPDDGKEDAQGGDSQSVAVVAYWKKGDKKTLQIVKGRTEMVNGQMVDQKQLNSKVELTVLEATPTGYVVQWQYMDSNWLQSDPYIKKWGKELAGIVDKLIFIYEIDELGVFKQLLNWQEIQKLAMTALNKAEQVAPTQSYDFKLAVAQLRSIFKNQQSIEGKLAQEILLYHSPYGNEYSANQLIEYEDAVLNLTGGEPIPAAASIMIQNVDNTRKTCEMVHTLNSDPNATKKQVGNILRSMNAGEAQIAGLQLATHDTNTYQIDFYNGWVYDLQHKRIVQAPNLERTDYTYIQMK